MLRSHGVRLSSVVFITTLLIHKMAFLNMAEPMVVQIAVTFYLKVFFFFLLTNKSKENVAIQIKIHNSYMDTS